MSLLQQFPGQSEQPMPAPPCAAPSAATLLGRQATEEVSAPSRTALSWSSQWQSPSQPRFRGSATEQFSPFLQAETQIVKNLVSLQGVGELLNISWNVPHRDSLPATVKRPSAHIAPHVSWNPPQQGVGQDSELSGVAQAYVLEDRSAVARFIRRNHLLDLLLEAREPLASAFGEATVKKLTLVEDDEGFTTLFGLILIPGSLSEAKRALDSFDERWWLAHSRDSGGRLNFDFELI